jgi:transcriptional regulator with GAF, ATPase, and Fis domain
MTEQQALQSINKIVYGIMDDGNNVTVESLTLLSIDKNKKYITILLKPATGDNFRSTLSNYYVDQISALTACKARLDDAIKATKRELESQQKSLLELLSNQQKLDRQIIKQSRLSSIRK